MKRPMTMFVALIAAAAAAQTVDYDADVQPLFDTHCVFCHGSSQPAAGLDLSAGQSYENLVDAASANYAPALRVAPGDPDESVLWNKLADTGEFGGVMPQGGQIPQDRIEVITTWILELLPVSAQDETWGAIKGSF